MAAPFAKGPPSARRDAVDAPSATTDDLVATGDSACMFEAMQRRIDRTFGQIEYASAAITKGLDYRVAVRRTTFEYREYQRIEVPFELLGGHT